MASGNEKIGDLVRRGILLFSTAVPIPAAALVAAASAAVITKVLDIHQRRVSEILSMELTLPHISRVQPDDEQVALFFARNPAYPELEREFDPEIRSKNIRRLHQLYPFVHNALILKKQIPALLYHRQIENGNFRDMALKYEELSRGFSNIDGDVKARSTIDHFGADLFEVLTEVYDSIKDDLKTKQNKFAFDTIDYILELTTL